MTREDLAQASRSQLIERTLRAHEEADRERKERERIHARLEQVEQQLRWFQKQLFGKKSERRSSSPIPHS